jgi:hypothetical protein
VQIAAAETIVAVPLIARPGKAPGSPGRCNQVLAALRALNPGQLRQVLRGREAERARMVALLNDARAGTLPNRPLLYQGAARRPRSRPAHSLRAAPAAPSSSGAGRRARLIRLIGCAVLHRIDRPRQSGRVNGAYGVTARWRFAPSLTQPACRATQRLREQRRTMASTARHID